jgi:glyoxylase-like metal-dependent hydrolase (beta-lactamase superfamily II)
VGAYPFIDWWAGGSLQGMIDELDRLLPRLSDRTRVVPGHGPVIDRADAAGYRDMLATILARARAARASGEKLDAFLAGRPTAEFDAGRGGARRGRQFATLVWLGVAGDGASD